jgi:hypothetical protein
MLHESTIEKICRIPNFLLDSGNVSLLAIVFKDCCPEQLSEVSEAEIEMYLRRYPQLLDDWLWFTEFWFSEDRNSMPARSQWRAWDFSGLPDEYAACALLVKAVAEELVGLR